MEPAVVVVAILVLVLLIHARGGDEQAICEGQPCVVGSGASWLATGAAVAAPPLVWAGVVWTRRLDTRDDLGPFARRAVPDIEEMAEVVWFLVAVVLSYLLIRRGPTIPIVDSSWPNSWLEGRLGTEGGHDLVPSRLSWFMVGALLAMPAGFSAGTAAGREWFGRRGAFSAEPGEDRVE